MTRDEMRFEAAKAFAAAMLVNGNSLFSISFRDVVQEADALLAELERTKPECEHRTVVGSVSRPYEGTCQACGKTVRWAPAEL